MIVLYAGSKMATSNHILYYSDSYIVAGEKINKEELIIFGRPIFIDDVVNLELVFKSKLNQKCFDDQRIYQGGVMAIKLLPFRNITLKKNLD